jgi:hypothetical protein
MDSQITRRVRLLQGLNPDRRGTVRFPVNLELRYSVVGHRRPAENGSGRTIDMSSSGLSFTPDTPLSIGQTLDVSIDWPVLLDGGVPLQLVVSGVVVRSGGAVIAMRIERHEFKTRRAELRAVTRQESVRSRGSANHSAEFAAIP